MERIRSQRARIPGNGGASDHVLGRTRIKEEPVTSLYVGIDVSKKDLAVSVWLDESAQPLKPVPNTRHGFGRLAKQLAGIVGADQTIHLVLEPSGGYEWALVAWARTQEWWVSLPNPLQVRRWAQGQGIRAKTDPADSAMLAQFGAIYQPAPQGPLPANVEELDQLLERKADLEKLLRQERNRQDIRLRHPALPPAVRENLEQVINALEKALKEIEAEIDALMARHHDLKRSYRLLLSVAGIGEKTVLDILVFLYRWQALTNGEGDAKGLTAYAGLDPTSYSSGSSVFKPARISKKGDSYLRARLVAAARGGTSRGNSPLRLFFLRLTGRNKPLYLAWVASARKILVWAWAVFRDQKPFDRLKALPAHSHP